MHGVSAQPGSRNFGDAAISPKGGYAAAVPNNIKEWEETGRTFSPLTLA